MKYKHNKTGRIATKREGKNYYEYLNSPDALIENSIPADMVEDSLDWSIVKPLEFTTEDGYKVYKGAKEKLVYVKPSLDIVSCKAIELWSYKDFDYARDEIQKGYLYFLDVEKATEHIIYNTKLFSINDIATVYVTANRRPDKFNNHEKQPKALLELAKKLMQ